MRYKNNTKTARNYSIMWMRDEEDLTFQAIADKLGISKQRVNDLYWRYKNNQNKDK